MKIPKFSESNTVWYVIMAIGGAAIAAMGIFAANPAKNIPREAITPHWPRYYSSASPMIDDNTPSIWFGAGGKSPYPNEITRPQSYYDTMWPVNRGHDILGSDYDIDEYGAV